MHQVAPLILIAWVALSNALSASAFSPYSVVKRPHFRFNRGPFYSNYLSDVSPVTSAKQAEEDAEKGEGSFVNDGPLAWMQSYLELFGVKEGKSLFAGPIPVNVDESKKVSEAEASNRRLQASKDLTNIGMDERARRDKAGDVFRAISAVYIAWASLLADDGGFSGHLLRFASVVPVFFAVGYKLSAKTGL
jgi:hypothetical protein